MAENLMKVPAKGILKNSTSFEGSTSTKGCTARGAKWDEMNILATHHPPDKDYGHMKIEEPKTPFSYHGEDSGDEGEGHDLDSKLLAEKLAADSQKHTLQEPEELEDSEDEDEEDNDPESKEKKKSFEHKRKAHYNEFMAVKLARQLMENDEEDVESNEEEKLEANVSNNQTEKEIPTGLQQNSAEDTEGDLID